MSEAMPKPEPENGARGDAHVQAPPAGPPARGTPVEQILALAVARFISAPADTAPEANLEAIEVRGGIPLPALGAVAELLAHIHTAVPTDALANP